MTKDGWPILVAFFATRVGPLTGYASGVKHPFEVRIHLFLFDEFPPAGLRDAFPHGRAKTSVLIKQAQGGIPHQWISRRQCYREIGRFVILSGATAARSGAVAESKDPYQLKFAAARQGILPCSR